MSFKALVIGVAALAWALPAAAQERGTVEFGAFGSGAIFRAANNIWLDKGYGGGGRFGAFLDHRFSMEFEDAEMRASRLHGLKDVNVGLLSARLVAWDHPRGPLTAFVGIGGGGSTETNFLHSYDVSVMGGFKTPINDHSAFRIDFVNTWLANYNWTTYQSVRLGVSWFRHAGKEPRPMSSAVPVPSSVVQR